MIKGRLDSQREALISLPLRGVRGEGQAIEAMIDTGYNGFLTLPPDLIEELNLSFLRSSRAILGDGSTVEFDIHEGTVIWSDRLRRIPIDTADVSPLLGMGLLYAHELKMEVVEGGEVLIRALRPS
jgi:clan AA aspartic protease